jgi:putative nucleotidyltransferase with HDIG domain
MGKKILIVEDDTYFREALKDLLKSHYTVLEAPNGKSAKEILSMQSVDAVLSDIQMPGLTGLELLEWSVQHKPVPFIIMTGFSMVLETKSAFDLGAKGFIAKPFNNQELLDTIKTVLKEPNESEQFPVQDPTHEYCKVSINEFVARPKIEFDVYIKLSDTKIIKIAHTGEEIPREKLTYYREKGVKHLHILKADFGKLVQFNFDLVKIMKGRPEVSDSKKLSFLKYTGEVLLEKTFVQGLDKEAFSEAKSFLETKVSTISQMGDTIDLLTVLNSHSDSLYAHSLGVSLYSVMIAKKMQVESNSTLFKLSMAGLYHDIGKKEIDHSLLEKPRHLVSQEERRIIENHVVRGQEILSAMPHIPSDVVQIVFEHHEDVKSLGYPLGKGRHDQHPLSRIVQCANIFIENTLESPHCAGRSAISAIEYITKIHGHKIDTECLNALKSLFLK